MQMNTDEVANNLLSVKNRFYASLTDEEKEALEKFNSLFSGDINGK